MCKFSLFIPGSQSLKEKRRVLRSIKDRVSSTFSVMTAEVDAQDTWQRAVLGFAVVGNDQTTLQALIAKILSFIESLGEAEIIEKHEEVVRL